VGVTAGGTQAVEIAHPQPGGLKKHQTELSSGKDNKRRRYAMKDKYLYETFSSEASQFDNSFTNYLNEKYSDQWKVKDCQVHRESDHISASCMFKRKS
jgi:hypothetical protein